MSFIPEARGGTSEVSRTVALATYRNDTVIVLHPDDLVHRQDNPLDWLHESFAYGAESAAGRILAFDGEYRGPVIRLTTQGLSERERTWAGGSWTFGYEVRHGKVFVGTAASLNYVDFQKSDARLRKLLPEDGFELSNGSYAVTVHPLEWESEPGALKPDGKRAADALAEYVIVFQPVDDLHKIETASTPIFLERRRSSTPARMKSFSLQSDYEQPTEEPGPQPFAVVSTPDVPVVTGFMQAVPDAEGVQATSRKLGIRGLVAAAEAREEALAVVVETRAYEGPDSGHPVVSLTLAGGRLVRIRTLREHQGLRLAEVEPVSRPSSTVPASEIVALKQEVEALAERSHEFRRRLLETSARGFLVESVRKLRTRAGKPDLYAAALAKRDGKFRAGFYELDRMQSLTSAEAFTTWLIHMLDLPMRRGLELLAQSDADRIAELRQHLIIR
jgi:hypothetical protein